MLLHEHQVDERTGIFSFFQGLAGVLMLLVSIVLSASSTLAGLTTDQTTVRIAPGPATLAGIPEINVSVLYSGDDNTNNSIRIEWGEDGTGFSLGSHRVRHRVLRSASARSAAFPGQVSA